MPAPARALTRHAILNGVAFSPLVGPVERLAFYERRIEHLTSLERPLTARENQALARAQERLLVLTGLLASCE